MQVKDRNKNRKSIGLLALVGLFCQLGLAPSIALGGGHPNFALLFTAVVALSIGGGTGVAAGFAAGLVYDLSTTGPIGLMALILTITAYVLGIEVHDRISEEPLMTIIPFVGAALSVSLTYSLLALAFGMGESLFDAIFLRALPSALLTTVFYVPFVLILGRTRRGGGVRPGTPGRQSRYTIGNR